MSFGCSAIFDPDLPVEASGSGLTKTPDFTIVTGFINRSPKDWQKIAKRSHRPMSLPRCNPFNAWGCRAYAAAAALFGSVSPV
jgi:hypothetical protein